MAEDRRAPVKGRDWQLVRRLMSEDAWVSGCDAALVQAINLSRDFEDLRTTWKQSRGPGAESWRKRWRVALFGDEATGTAEDPAVYCAPDKTQDPPGEGENHKMWRAPRVYPTE
ncbi:MAG: hypothetical protein ACYTAN_13370 [Planctomycetota bacterium]|jgi:hypothetical protein